MDQKKTEAAKNEVYFELDSARSLIRQVDSDKKEYDERAVDLMGIATLKLARKVTYIYVPVRRVTLF